MYSTDEEESTDISISDFDLNLTHEQNMRRRHASTYVKMTYNYNYKKFAGWERESKDVSPYYYDLCADYIRANFLKRPAKVITKKPAKVITKKPAKIQ